MRQVPRYTLVGSGRLARHFACYFDFLGLSYSTWARPSTAPVPEAEFTLLLITDTAIEPFIKAHPELSGRTLVHCSGALVTPLAQSLHPLMTFSHDLYTLDVYKSIAFIGETQNCPLPDLPNPYYSIPAQDRPYYHALCVLSGNFSVLLWSKLFSELQARWQIPAEAAHPYLKRITENLLSEGPKALTGPLVRGDERTLHANLESLKHDPFEKVYRAFIEAYRSPS